LKKNASLRRRRAFREPRARFLIVCEGTVTEPLYFKEIRRTERGLIELEIVPAGVPKTVVERAVQMKKESQREAHSRRDDNLKYDHVWCVFDVDEHAFVPEAKQQALANAIDVAVSNPCFELWLLLHFQDQTAHVERDRVQRLCREHMPGYDKAPPCDALMPRRSQAIERASQLESWQASRGNAGENPSTGVHRLIQQILAICRHS
jgi:RloB-like protein